ncbi:DUF6197 family protein [Pseudonocardia broussonetiae]|uniref:Uncharacterized protein n=1 Tax=Pseudonocardia broussonetiae TaxID=2736640 RepID=A0A6M6JQ30_9PSEU|nr:hypothetical protein [Pseudonocardia broussonetiae]QJY49998.1 hypothetical protein HOP40_33015 [Pseudonocardia broussonetiae]
MTVAVLESRGAVLSGTTAPAPPSVLGVAEQILERGWLQHGWYQREPAPLRRRLLSGSPRPDEVRSACLVAAIAVAAHRGTFFVDVERDALPWMDQVWRVLHDGDPPHRLRPRERIRDLVAWNDEPGRTRREVIAAVRAAATEPLRRATLTTQTAQET